jgi:iron complex outermembrane receptor protein
MAVRRHLLLAAALPIAVASGAFGQATPPEAWTSIVVTGSRFPRIGAEPFAPVTTIGRDEIERGGYATAGELFFALPLNSGGAPNVNNGDGLANPGYAGVSLRGVGTNATLLLVNGRRLAPYAFSGSAVDVNSIPLAAIDRVEILRDGASAQYGADAIAGVVNFVLRSDYAGAEARVGGGWTQGGGASEGAATVSAGGRAGKLAWLATLDYRANSAIGATQRDFSRTAYLPDKGIDYTSAIGFPGAYSFDLSTPYAEFSAAGLDCDPARFPGAVPQGDLCNYDYVVDSYIVPKGDKASGFGRLALDLGDDALAYAELVLTRSDYTYRTSPTPVWGGYTPTGEPFVLRATSPYNTFGTDVQFWWRTLQLGTRTSDIEAAGDRAVVGVAWKAGTWDLDAAAGTSGSRARQHFAGGYVSETRLREVLATSGRVNPFGETLPQDVPVLDSIEASGLAREATARVGWVDAKGATDLGTPWGSPLRLALGAEGRWERLEDRSGDLLRSGDVVGIAATQPLVEGSRRAAAAYGEVVAPVGSTFELQGSLRGDWYSDFGAAFTPRVALLWSPLRWASLRGSYSKSFRAPNLAELYTEQVAGLTGPLDDPVRCPGGVPAPGADPQTDCGASFGQIGGGNPGLEPERATNWLAGIVLRPTTGLTLAATFWRIAKTNNVGIVQDATILDPLYYPSLSQFVIRRPPSTSDIANGLPGPIEAVLTNNQNLGAGRYSGWDFELAAGLPGVWGGRLDAGALAVLMTKFEQQLQPGTDYVDFLGASVNGTPVQRWRASAYAKWSRGPWGLGANTTFIGSYLDENPGPDGVYPRIASWFTLGLQASYAAGSAELRIGVQNVFDRAPPFSNKATAFTVGWDDLTHDPRGRLFYGALRYAF